jgi:putative SOS response-associated peptidase YedK
MCYDIKTSLEKQLRRAILDGNQSQIDEINEKLSIFSPDKIELNHTSGFDHPTLIIYTNDTPYKPELATWGLVPDWVESSEQKQVLWNKTLNARGETIFEKASFMKSAQHYRCLIFLEGFFEHHHYKGKTYPYFISHKDKDLFPVAGLYSNWVDLETGELIKTFSIVTTKANSDMAKIHNNTKLAEPRMPLILQEEMQEDWLIEIKNENDQTKIENLVKPYPDNLLRSFTVGPIKGKKAIGNKNTVIKQHIYPELIAEQGTLF